MTAAYHCEVACSDEQMRALLPQWRRLQQQAGRDIHGFQTAHWAQSWLQAVQSSKNGQQGGCSPCILTVRDAKGELVLLWPLMREHYPLRLTVITWLSDPYGQYGDVLTSLSGEQLDAAMDVALRELRRQGGDLVRLRHVRADAAAFPWLSRRFRKSSDACAAPWLDLAAFSSVEELEGRYSGKQRRRRRKLHKALARHLGTEPRLRIMTSGQEVHAAISRIIACKRQWLKEKGLVSRALFSGHVEAFLHELANNMPLGQTRDAHQPAFVISVLEANGRQISWEIGMRYQRRHYAYITAHEPEFTRFSIGRVHMDLAQQQALRDGMKVFDLLVPDAPHKKSFSDHATPVSGFFLPLSMRGRLLGQTYLNHLRPFLRDVYHRIPPEIRRMLRLSDMVDHDHGMHH